MATLLEGSKQSQSNNLKRATPNNRDAQYLQDTVAALESFKITGLIVFLDTAKECLDKLHESIHQML